MPPQNFSGLTDEELKAMEGNERANVEARIKCLRNIQVLLDAAVMEMQQYSAVVSQLDTNRARTNFTNITTISSTTTTTTVKTEPAVVVSSSPTSGEATTSAATATAASEDIKPMLPTAETGARPKVKSQQDQKDDTSHESGDKNETTDEQDEVRKRRLERFGSSPANSE